MSRPRSLQQRLLVLVLGSVSGVWLASAAMTWVDARHELDELLDAHLAQAAALLVAQQAGEIEDDDHGIDAPTLHRYAPKVAFQVFHEGRLALRSANAPRAPMIDPGEHLRSGFTTVALDGAAWRVFAAYGAQRDVQVYVGEQVDSRRSILWAVLRSALWPFVLALPLLGLALWWAVKRGIEPLRRLAQTLAQRQAQALQPVAVAGAPAEMVPMIEALNSLFGRIAELMESERRFTADAAHELRTPIAAIRAQAQVALGEADDAQRRHALGATLEGCDRAVRVVEQLLTLSRLESDATSGKAAESTPVDLASLVRQAAADLAAQAIERGQSIEVEAAGPCEVEGDRVLLAVLVRNLIDNAIRYNCPRGDVKLTVARHGGRVRLEVEDSGPGMSEHDIERLGERFFRVLGSGQSGSGLGWSIVRRIAAAHDARIDVVRSIALGGLKVSIDWPGHDRAPR